MPASDVEQSYVEQGKKRDSSSSDEPLDISDETDKLPVGDIELNKEQNINQFISDIRHSNDSMERTSILDHGRGTNESQPHCSQSLQPEHHAGVGRPQLSKVEEMVRDAEKFRARIVDVPGRTDTANVDMVNVSVNRNEKVYHSALLDEDYLLVGNYVEDQIK